MAKPAERQILPNLNSLSLPIYLWRLFTELRRRHFLLGPQDYDEVRQALRLGFGWESPQALLNLLCMLWAKSKPEQDILIALFEQDKEISDWILPVFETEDVIDIFLHLEETSVTALEENSVRDIFIRILL